MNYVRLRRSRITTKARQRLVGKHCGQFLANPPGPELVGLTAITFEPASETPSMVEQTIRPLGTTIMIVAGYQEHPYKPDRICMPICGMYATAAADGSVSYGGKGSYVFVRDAAIRSRPKRNTRAIDYLREASLLDTSMRMDATCRRVVAKRCRLPTIPILPRILLGFAPFEVPSYADSPGLRRLAARQLGMPAEKLGVNGEILLNRLLRDVWQNHLIGPDHPENATGLVLVDAELCTDARRSLRIFEDFRELIGDRSWNPARTIKFPTIDNPAPGILHQQDIQSAQDFDRVTETQLEQLERGMRQALGEGFERVGQCLIFDALTNPCRPVLDCRTAIRLLRERLMPSLAECCTDAELVQAAHEPDRPLLVRGRCRLQVVARMHPTLDSQELRRRATIQFAGPARTQSRHRSKLVEKRSM